jgi:D-alanyl-D-alanine carboxypeptidase
MAGRGNLRKGRRRVAHLIAVGTLALLALPATAIAGTTAASAHEAGAAAKRLPPIHRGKLTRKVKAYMRKNDIPGAVVGVFRPGRAPYKKGFGVRNTATDRPMKPQLGMRVGSVTKSFVVTGVLQLVDQGLVGLDDPISKYVPGVPSGDEITIRQLAGMRSGLYNYLADLIDTEIPADPERQWTVSELLGIGFSHPLLFEPGTEFDYSNTNTLLLGLVVARVSGKPLATYIDENITEPLGLKHTFLPAGAEFPRPHARGYTDWGQPPGEYADATDWNASYAEAAGGMISRMSDLRKWARVVATGKLLSPETQRERTEFLPSPGEGGATYGLGIMNYNGWVAHDGNLAGYISYPFYLAKPKTTLVVIFNSNYDVLDRVLMMRTITKIITPNDLWPDPRASSEP